MPSPYRYHKLEDAGIAFLNGHYEEAIKLYHEAATDTTLIDVPTLNEIENLNTSSVSIEVDPKTFHAYQTAYAYFQEYSLLVYLHRQNEADAIFKTMKALYPGSAKGMSS